MFFCSNVNSYNPSLLIICRLSFLEFVMPVGELYLARLKCLEKKILGKYIGIKVIPRLCSAFSFLSVLIQHH